MNGIITKMTTMMIISVVIISLAILAEFSLFYNSVTAGIDITEKNLLNQPSSLLLSSSNLPSHTLDTKKLKIVLLTDALFSDAGWGAFGYNAAQELNNKYGYNIDFKDNVAIPDIENTLRNILIQGTT
jgi:basic membrane protein A